MRPEAYLAPPSSCSRTSSSMLSARAARPPCLHLSANLPACATGQELALTPNDYPTRSLLLVTVKPFTVIATNALRGHNPGPSYSAPFAGLLTNLARVAFGPPLDSEDS